MEFDSFVVAWPSLAEQGLSLHPLKTPWTPKNRKCQSDLVHYSFQATVIQKTLNPLLQPHPPDKKQ